MSINMSMSINSVWMYSYTESNGMWIGESAGQRDSEEEWHCGDFGREHGTHSGDGNRAWCSDRAGQSSHTSSDTAGDGESLRCLNRCVTKSWFPWSDLPTRTGSKGSTLFLQKLDHALVCEWGHRLYCAVSRHHQRWFSPSSCTLLTSYLWILSMMLWNL